MTQNTIRAQVRKIREIFAILLRSKVGESSEELTENDLLDAMRIIEDVVIERLDGDPLEWKSDNKRNFEVLFESIKTESIEAIRDYFAGEKPQRGATIHTLNTLILEGIIDVLMVAGPERAPNLVTAIRKALAREVINLRVCNEDDALVARAVIAEYKKLRAARMKKPKRMTTAQRLAAIESIALRLQAA